MQFACSAELELQIIAQLLLLLFRPVQQFRIFLFQLLPELCLVLQLLLQLLSGHMRSLALLIALSSF